MIKNYLFSFLFIGFVFGFGYGQTTIFNVNGSGVLPENWNGVNNITAQDIERGSYYLVDAGNPGDIIETDTYDLSAYTNATFEVDIRSFGSGNHNALLVEVSINGGTTFTQSYVTSITTNSYITRTLNISTVSANTVLRLSVEGISDRGVRLQNLVLTASGSAGPTITVNQTTGGTISPSTTSVNSGDDQSFTATADPCYTFTNWIVDGSNAGNTNPFIFTNVTGDHDISAVYTPTGNTVAFNNNGGSGTMTPQTDCNPTNLTLNSFTNAGFTFNNWNTALNGSGIDYADGASYSFDADVTLYAQWDIYVGPCASESFSNIGPYSGYTTENWTGDDGVIWTATDSRTDRTINGKAITVRNGSLTSATFSGGIGSITLTTELTFNDSAGNLIVRVNGSNIGTIPYSASTQTTTISNN